MVQHGRLKVKVPGAYTNQRIDLHRVDEAQGAEESVELASYTSATALEEQSAALLGRAVTILPTTWPYPNPNPND